LGINKTIPRYIPCHIHNFDRNPIIKANLSKEEIFNIKVLGSVYPFRTNNYIIEELIDWKKVPDDPIYRLVFPHLDMLNEHDFAEMAYLLHMGSGKTKIESKANSIRQRLNPHPGEQVTANIPEINGNRLEGIQHKYQETVLFFPKQAQTCHAYCSFCFRWPQFVNSSLYRFQNDDVNTLISYLKRNPEVSDILFTGGDPLIMRTNLLKRYIEPLIEADLPNLKNLRIGSKVLGFWPFRLSEGNPDADDLLTLFERVINSGKHLTLMSHISHPVELSTPIVKDVICRLRNIGVTLRTQSPIVKHVNDSHSLWKDMLSLQVQLGLIPYYMFIARNTGAQNYFSVPLAEAYRVFSKAIRNVSGLAKTVRGPVMSTKFGKILIQGISSIGGQKLFHLSFIQARNQDWINKPFFAKYDENARWLDELIPYFHQAEYFSNLVFQELFEEENRVAQNLEYI